MTGDGVEFLDDPQDAALIAAEPDPERRTGWQRARIPVLALAVAAVVVVGALRLGTAAHGPPTARAAAPSRVPSVSSAPIVLPPLTPSRATLTYALDPSDGSLSLVAGPATIAVGGLSDLRDCPGPCSFNVPAPVLSAIRQAFPDLNQLLATDLRRTSKPGSQLLERDVSGGTRTAAIMIMIEPTKRGDRAGAGVVRTEPQVGSDGVLVDYTRLRAGYTIRISVSVPRASSVRGTVLEGLAADPRLLAQR